MKWHKEVWDAFQESERKREAQAAIDREVISRPLLQRTKVLKLPIGGDALLGARCLRRRYTYGRPRRDGGVTVQAVRIRVSGQNGDTTRTNEWRPRGLYRIRERTESRSCTYEPPWLLVRFPVRVGDSWTVEDRGCRGERPREGSSSTSRTTVLREETVEVGGVDVECVVIEEVTETTIDNDELKAESTSTDTYWFAPAFGLYVRTESTAHSDSESRSEGAPFTVTFDSQTTSQLVSLQPS